MPNVSPVVWDLDRVVRLDPTAKLVLVYLLSCPQELPGLVRGAYDSLAEAIRLPRDHVQAASEALAASELLEMDLGKRMLRVPLALGANPPGNPNIIRAWWRRWREFPDSDLRARHAHGVAHVVANVIFRTDRGRKPMAWLQVWEVTFRQVAGELREVANCKCGHSDIVRPVTQQLYDRSQNQESFSFNNIKPFERCVSGSVSVSGDLDLDRERGCGGEGLEPREQSEPTDPQADAVAGRNGNGKGHANGKWRKRAAAGSAPAPLPFSIADLLAKLADTSRGRFVAHPFDSRVATPLTETIRECERNGLSLEAIGEVGEWMAAGGLAWMDSPPNARWAAKAGNLLSAIGAARAWIAAGRPALVNGRARDVTRGYASHPDTTEGYDAKENIPW